MDARLFPGETEPEEFRVLVRAGRVSRCSQFGTLRFRSILWPMTTKRGWPGKFLSNLYAAIDHVLGCWKRGLSMLSNQYTATATCDGVKKVQRK